MIADDIEWRISSPGEMELVGTSIKIIHDPGYTAAYEISWGGNMLAEGRKKSLDAAKEFAINTLIPRLIEMGQTP